MTSKRDSYYEEEQIEIKPSTELIPDVYEHFEDSKSKLILHTFCSEDDPDKENEKLFLETVKDLGYTIEENNRHSLDNTDNFTEVLNNIRYECSTDTAGLILLFCGFTPNQDELEVFDGNTITNYNIQQIWMQFNSHKCPQIKNKPKIFIFSLTSPAPVVQTDSKRYFATFQSAYDTPSEADILVILHKAEGSLNDRTEFMDSFCQTIEEYGKTENIVTLASCAATTTPTLVISTLTKNFYFTNSNIRGHYLSIVNNHEELKTHLNDIKGAVNKKNENKKEKKTLSSFRESFRRIRKPKQEKPIKEIEDAPTSSSNKPDGKSSSPTANNSNKKTTQNVSVRSPSVEPEKTNQKKLNVKQNKPIWKY